MLDFSTIREWKVSVRGMPRQVLKVTNPASDVIWRKKLLVKFYGNGGTPEESSRWVKYELKLGSLPTATRDGYYLAGWYTASAGGDKVTPDTVITGASAFYAQWTSADSLLVTDAQEKIETDAGDCIKIKES